MAQLPTGDAGTPTTPPPSHGNTFVFHGLLLSAMAAGTFFTTSMAVFAAPLRDGLGISRAQVGLIVTMSVAFGAVLSPNIGRFIDRIGGRRATAAVFAASAVSFVLGAVAPFYAFLLLAAAVAGVAQAASNPATNKLITHHVGAGMRATVTGIKQSGVQVAAFFSGVAIPTMAALVGWRATMLVIAALIGLFVPATLLALPPEVSPDPTRSRHHPTRLTPAVRWLTLYGLLMGLASSVMFLIPLFVEESLGYGEQTAGFVAAVVGLAAVAGRIAWARWSEPRRRFAAALGLIGLLTVVSAILMLMASRTTGALVWLGAGLVGLSAMSWNAPGMLAVMDDSGVEAAGRSSGVVVAGFLLGMGIGPPLYGAVADATGSYDPMWLMTVAVALAAAATTRLWRPTSGPS